jgi:tRNA nucleotidyltransferase (CCA-adding enzyme)
MKIYTVGGAVRDRLLGLPVKDHDHVVVGATPEDMVRAGYLPIGRDFPVFLHPDTREEYALARTERKSGRGYQGFVFFADGAVTLEQDLARRDLTINAMAQDEHGQIIDPYGGQADLRARVFRHVGPAFAEDPVRILRLARFAARFADFQVAPETSALLREMVNSGEVDALVPERIWQEFARGLGEAQPSRMLRILHACGALARVAPLFDLEFDLDGQSGRAEVVLRALDRAAQAGLSVAQRFAVLACAAGQHDVPALQAQAEALRVPGDCRELAVMLAREFAALSLVLDVNATLALFERCDALRRPDRFAHLLAAWGILFGDAAPAVLPVVPPAEGPVSAEQQTHQLLKLLAAARHVDAGAAARGAPTPALIPERVRAARVQSMNQAMAGMRASPG